MQEGKQKVTFNNFKSRLFWTFLPLRSKIQSSWFYQPLTIFIIIVIGLGWLGLIYLDQLIAEETIYSYNLKNINNLASSIGVIFTAVTIILLYANYKQQQKEFSAINKSSIKANDVQLILHEKIVFEKDIEKAIQKIRLVANSISMEYNAHINHMNEFILLNGEILTYRNEDYSKLVEELEEKGFKVLVSTLLKLNRQLAISFHLIESKDVINLMLTSIPEEVERFLDVVYNKKLKDNFSKLVPTVELVNPKYGYRDFYDLVNSTMTLNKVLKSTPRWEMMETPIEKNK